MATDVDGHHGGELRKKTFTFTKENDKVLARLDTKNQTSCTGSFSCHMSQTLQQKIFSIVQLCSKTISVVIIFWRKKQCEKYYFM